MKYIEYFSTDKLYRIKGRKISKRAILTIGICATILLFISSLLCFRVAVKINSQDGLVKYSENGKIDYKIYLKDNNYYNTSYLEKGMQYVASLIKTINVRFDYQMHSDSKIDFDTNYKVVGEVQITEKDDPTKILYSKKEDLVSNKNITKVDNNYVINEEIDIDYDKYNELVNSYKRDYGLIVSSNLILSLEVDTKGNVNNVENALNKNNKLQMSIPLSEQTVNIKMDADEIEDGGTLLNSNKLFTISNYLMFIVFIILFVITIASIVLDIYFYIKNFKKDKYKETVEKILRQYDRIIVNGKISIDESKFKNKVYPDTIEEMVDAAQTLEVPIYYYEAIPNEKSFFVIIKNNTLYKYRLTRAFLEKNPNNKKEDKQNTFDDKNDDESVNKFNFEDTTPVKLKDDIDTDKNEKESEEDNL